VKEMNPGKSKLMQQKFIAAYDGNATEAARVAGYSCPGSAGNRLFKNVEIMREIQQRNNKQTAPLIATRTQRQEFWTKTMLNDDLEIRDRLKASELLGRSEADFTDKQTVDGELKLISVGTILDELDRRGKHGSG
jgi:phage terminase small subunit